MASNYSYSNLMKHGLGSSSNNQMNHIDFCDDIFDIEDDDQDIIDDSEAILDQYHHNFDFEGFRTNIDDEEMDRDNAYIWDDSDTQKYKPSSEEKENDKYKERETQELQQSLSQKLSQLSTEDNRMRHPEDDHADDVVHGTKRSCSTTPLTPNLIVKKSRSDVSVDSTMDDEVIIPEYLQINQPLFQDLLMNLITKWHLTLAADEIQSIAVLKHRIASMSLDYQLWSAYLAVGTGQWSIGNDKQKSLVDQCFWPLCVKEKSSISSDMNNHDIQALKQSYEMITRQQLDTFVLKIENYEQQLQELIDCTIHLPDQVEKAIDRYVQNYGIRPIQIRIDYLIKKLEFDRDIEIHQREGQQRQPTEYQDTTLQRLYALILDQVKAKQIVNEIQQRILCDRPLKTTMTSSLLMEFNGLTDTYTDEQERWRAFYRYAQSIQQRKTDHMLNMLIEKERHIQRCSDAFSRAIQQANMKDAFDKDYSIRHFLDLIPRRFDLYQNKMRSLDQYRFTYVFRNRYDTTLNQLQQEQTRQFSPSIIIDTSSHGLNNEQLRLLQRGPSYVPPCQLFMQPTPIKQTNDERLTNLYASFKHQLTVLFSQYQINMVQSMFLQHEISNAFHHAFSVFIPTSLYERALYEKQLIDSIRKHLKEHQLILRRTADQRNTFYLGDRQQFQRLAEQYMFNADCFEYCETVNDNNLSVTYDYIQSVSRTINQELERLFNGNSSQKNFIEKLSIDVKKTMFPYLYFLPDCSKNNLELKPIVIAHRSMTSKIGEYLDGLLRPIVQRTIHSTSSVDGADFMKKLYQYGYNERRFRPHTLLVSMKILHFDTIATHSNMLLALEGFLHESLAGPNIEQMSIKKFLDLTSLFLRNNRFYYNGIIYRFMRGGPKHMPIVETLSNLFVYVWQKILVHELKLQNEFFGRCRDQLFFTWTQTIDVFEQGLERVRKRANHINFDYKIGFQVDFLGALIENQKCVLYTCVNHDEMSQKYTLPYVHRHALVEHSHWLRSSLIRAVRYCTSVHDFNRERAYLQLTLLANGYRLDFIESRLAHFYNHFDVVSLRQTLDQQVYDRLRHQMFNFLSEQNKILKEEQDAREHKQWVQLIYPYQYGPRLEFERQCRQLLLQQLASRLKIATNKMKIIFQTKQQYALNGLLSQQKPSSELVNQQFITKTKNA